MSYDRQLNVLVAILVTPLTFAGCTFFFVMPVKASLLVSAGVFLAAIIFGPRIAEVVTSVLPG
jgi:hypothetical protein